MEEYWYQSRAMRIFCYTCGAIFTAVWLILIPWMISTAASMGRHGEPSPEERDSLARLVERAKEDPQAAELLRAHEETQREIASFWEGLRLYVYWRCVPAIGMLGVSLAMIVAPIAAVRRHRQRALAWQTVREGSPSYRSGLTMALASLALFVLYGIWIMRLLFLDLPFLRPAGTTFSGCA
ncbi:MAG: hypothetical protein NTW87_12260, partial [Planctomycetota bacterium]|nr:hypothetical protein [Planctomycetota bacterium]